MHKIKLSLLLITVSFLFMFVIKVNTSELSDDIEEYNEKQTTHIQILTNQVYIRKDLGITTIPLFIDSDVVVNDAFTNKNDFYVKYENGILYL